MIGKNNENMSLGLFPEPSTQNFVSISTQSKHTADFNNDSTVTEFHNKCVNKIKK